MGIRGAALATVIAGFITPILLGWLFWTRYNDEQWQTHANFRYDRDLFRRMIRFGFPSGVHLFLDIASFSFFVLLTGRLGAEALSASNIALSVNTLAFMPLIGLGIAASILVGQHQGRRESEQAQRAGWAAFQMGLIYMVIIGAVFVFCPRTLFGLFAGRGESSVVLDDVLPTGRILLIIAAVWGLADAGNLILGSGLKGAGDTRFVMYYSVVLAWAMFAAGQYVIVEVLQRGIIASWLWTALYVFALSAGYFWRFASGRWKKIDVLGREDPASSPSDLKGSGNC
jgi:MATE family multidrug resistance protein